MSNMIISNLPVLVVLLPLAGALFCPVISYFGRRAGRLTSPWGMRERSGFSVPINRPQIRMLVMGQKRFVIDA